MFLGATCCKVQIAPSVWLASFHLLSLSLSLSSLPLSLSLLSDLSVDTKLVATQNRGKRDQQTKVFSRLDNCIRIPASHGFDSSYPHSSCILDHEAILTLKACQAIKTHHRTPSLETGPTSKCAPTVRAQRHMRSHTERAHAREKPRAANRKLPLQCTILHRTTKLY